MELIQISLSHSPLYYGDIKCTFSCMLQDSVCRLVFIHTINGGPSNLYPTVVCSSHDRTWLRIPIYENVSMYIRLLLVHGNCSPSSPTVQQL